MTCLRLLYAYEGYKTIHLKYVSFNIKLTKFILFIYTYIIATVYFFDCYRNIFYLSGGCFSNEFKNSMPTSREFKKKLATVPLKLYDVSFPFLK